MKIKLTQEQSDSLITKMLVQDYKRMMKRNNIEEDVHLMEAFQVLLEEYYLTSDEWLKLFNKVSEML